MARTDEALRAAVELFKLLNADEEVRRIAEMEELAEAERNEELASSIEAGIEKGKEMGRAEGHAEGRAEGEKLGLEKGSSAEKRNIAKKLMMQNIDIEVIKITTGLSDKELEKLAV